MVTITAWDDCSDTPVRASVDILILKLGSLNPGLLILVSL